MDGGGNFFFVLLRSCLVCIYKHFLFVLKMYFYICLPIGDLGFAVLCVLLLVELIYAIYSWMFASSLFWNLCSWFLFCCISVQKVWTECLRGRWGVWDFHTWLPSVQEKTCCVSGHFCYYLSTQLNRQMHNSRQNNVSFSAVTVRVVL